MRHETRQADCSLRPVGLTPLPWGRSVRAMVLQLRWLLAFLLVACSNTSASQAVCSDSLPCIAGQSCYAGYCQADSEVKLCKPLYGDAHLAPGATWLAITDRAPLDTATCAATVQPGADIDAVGLYRPDSNGVLRLIAVGHPGSASWLAPAVATPHCTTNTYADPATATGPRDQSGDAKNFMSLNGGTLLLQLGLCSQPTQTEITTCDGAGAVVALQSGDELDIYEIDDYYVAMGRMPATCACPPEDFQVSVQQDPSSTDDPVCLGLYTGTTSHIHVP